MRWHNTVPSTDQERVLLKFAWFPTKVGVTWIWLERYWQGQKSSGNHYFWNADRFLYEEFTMEQKRNLDKKVKWVIE